MALVYPPKVCITIVFDAIFFWGGGRGRRGVGGRENKMHYGLCETGKLTNPVGL